MPALYSIDEIQKNFEDSATNAENGHLSKSMKWMVVANLLLIAGLAAMFFSHPIFAAPLLLSAVLFNQKSNTHHVLAEMSNQHRAMAHLTELSGFARYEIAK
jgi:hypothetical protein